MPRDISGNYTLPPGNPVIPNDIIASSWANPTMSDIASALTDSLSRTGAGGMLVPFKNADGIAAAPGITWTNEPTTGFYRSATGVMSASILGAPIFSIDAAGITMAAGKQITATGGLTTGPLNISTGAVVANTPLISASQTWNNAAVAFIAAQIVVTDTASASGSILQRWILSGSTRMSLLKSGQLTLPAVGSGAGIVIGGDAQLYRSAANELRTPGGLTIDADLLTQGAATLNGNVAIGNAAGDTLTIAPNAVTWTNNPTHSGNHTFSGNIIANGALTVAGVTTLNGNTLIGNAATDTLTIAPNAVTWSNPVTHSNAHTFSGAVTVQGAFQSVGIDDNATVEVLNLANSNGSMTLGAAGAGFTVNRSVNDQILVLVGGSGTADGGNLQLYGSTHATQPGSIILRSGASNIIAYVASTGLMTISAITGIGITASASTRLALSAGTTAVSSLRIPHGAAPTAPVNGDIWTTTAGLFVRINGATVGPLT